ncbi:MAG: exosortase/archaeosortase family protein [Oleiphilaceae bacterium]|nr:exosortase/archaeosortase family protein [Oleiphilaceae bacterium]
MLIKGSFLDSGRFSLALFLLLFLFATWPTLAGLGIRWLKFDESYSHGFLVLVTSVFLCAGVWWRTKPNPGFYWPWLVPLAASAVLYMVGSILLIEAFQQVALIPLLVSGLLVLWGWRQALPFFVPIGLMVLSLPFWDYLAWPLQLITVAVNQFLLSWFDIDFAVEGIFVYFPGVGAFEIAHGCSGLRYFLVGTVLSLLYGEMNFDHWRSRILLVAAGVLLALIANWIRVFVIIYVGYESNMTSSLINEHDFFGWWVFAGTLVPLFFFGRWLEKKEQSEGSSKSTTESKINVVRSGPGSPVGALSVILPLLAVSAVSWLGVSSAPASVADFSSHHSASLVPSDRWLPLFEKDIAGWQPVIKHADRTLERSYLNRKNLDPEGRGSEELFVALYSYDFQRPGAEVVQYINRLYDPSELSLERTFNVNSGEGISLAGLTLRNGRSDVRINLAYGYYVEGRWETNELQAKFAQLPGVFNARTDASLLVIGLRCQDCNNEAILGDITPEIRKRTAKHLDSLYTERD